jgi:hypothetical protein
MLPLAVEIEPVWFEATEVGWTHASEPTCREKRLLLSRFTYERREGG